MTKITPDRIASELLALAAAVKNDDPRGLDMVQVYLYGLIATALRFTEDEASADDVLESVDSLITVAPLVRAQGGRKAAPTTH